jgi:hypothetical protein
VRDAALGILRSLIEGVVMRPRDGGFTVALALGSPMGSQTNEAAPKEAAFSGAYGRSVILVAGAGFEPATFRL